MRPENYTEFCRVTTENAQIILDNHIQIITVLNKLGIPMDILLASEFQFVQHLLSNQAQMLFEHEPEMKKELFLNALNKIVGRIDKIIQCGFEEADKYYKEENLVLEKQFKEDYENDLKKAGKK